MSAQALLRPYHRGVVQRHKATQCTPQGGARLRAHSPALSMPGGLARNDAQLGCPPEGRTGKEACSAQNTCTEVQTSGSPTLVKRRITSHAKRGVSRPIPSRGVQVEVGGSGHSGAHWRARAEPRWVKAPRWDLLRENCQLCAETPKPAFRV